MFVNNSLTVVVNDHIKTIDVINNMKHFIDTLSPDPWGLTLEFLLEKGHLGRKRNIRLLNSKDLYRRLY